MSLMSAVPHGEMDRARNFLEDTLANGPLDSEAVKSLAALEDISPSTLRRAKKERRIISKHVGYGADSKWQWSLAPEASSESHRNDGDPLKKVMNPFDDMNIFERNTQAPVKSSIISAEPKVSKMLIPMLMAKNKTYRLFNEVAVDSTVPATC